MDDSWRLRPLQPTTTSCPVCSFPHFPFCPLPHPHPHPHPHPSFDHRIGFSAGQITHRFPPDLSHPPFHHPPFPEHRTAPPFPVRESLPPPPFPDQDFPEREGLRKRMRVDDPNPLGLGLGFSSEDERRMKLIRNHGRQQNIPPPPPPPLPPPMPAYDGFLGSNGRIQEPLPSHQNHHIQTNSPFAETPRFLLQERTGFGGAGRRYEQFDYPVAQTAHPPLPPYRRYQQFDDSRPRTENFTVRAPEEQSFHDSQRQIYPAESSSYGYPATDSYPMMPHVDNLERKRSYMTATDNHRPAESRIELHSWHNEVMENPYELKHLYHEEIRKTPFETQSYHHPPVQEDFPSDSYRFTGMTGQDHFSEAFPPLPPQPPIPPPPEPSPPPYRPTTSVPMPPSMPSHVPDVPNNMQGSSEPHPPAQASFYNEPAMHNSIGFAAEGLPIMDQMPSKEYMERRYETFTSSHFHEEKPTVVDACHLFRQPHRASRPDHFVIILRGLPGSGKSYLAKTLRNLEVEAGGNAPRIHAMDDYFMIEVEKVEDSEGSKSSGSSRGKKQITKKVIEYCYEPELEEAYRSSMLKAFKKTLDEGNFTFVIVDDRNLRVADFAQFWAIAKRSGYEVYVLEATYKDPTGCAARNVHGFTVEDIQEMAKQWEEAPPLYMQLDIKSLFRGDDLSEQSIQEVDMDTDDAGCDDEETNNKLQHKEDLKMTATKILDHNLDAGSVKVGERWNTEEEDELTVPNELGKSKWSKDEDIENSNDGAQHLTALSGLVQAYGKGEKSVHWGDHVGQSGFSIAALQKQCRSSLVIGPGSGYNLISNPLLVDEDNVETFRSNNNESKRCFTEQLRAERESFKAVFDRRRQRIGGLWDAEDDQ